MSGIRTVTAEDLENGGWMCEGLCGRPFQPGDVAIPLTISDEFGIDPYKLKSMFMGGIGSDFDESSGRVLSDWCCGQCFASVASEPSEPASSPGPRTVLATHGSVDYVADAEANNPRVSSGERGAVMTDPEAAPPSVELTMEIVLAVRFSVTVAIDTRSDQTVEAMKDAALKKYHAAQRTSAWRKQFEDHEGHWAMGIYVGGETVEIEQVKNLPKRPGWGTGA